MTQTALTSAAVLIALAGTAAVSPRAYAAAPAAKPGEVPAKVTGGFDTDPRDRGRPVVLVAGALGVPADVFRDAFSHVRPAQGRGPTGDEARQNKQELLGRLAKYGVTNERLDEVSDYYRYRRENGETWKHRDAVVYAKVANGQVTGFRVADAGAGYSSAPTIAVDGHPGVTAKADVAFGKDLATNGSIAAVRLAPPTTTP